MRLTVQDRLILGACVALTGFIMSHGAPLITEATPRGIVSFELAAQPQRAQAMLDAWGADLIALARFNTYIDMCYLISYPLAISRLIAIVGGWRLMQSAVLAAGVFDLVENVLMLRAMSGSIDSGVTAAAVCAAIKFALVGAGLVAALVGWLTSKRRSGAHPPPAA